MSETTLTAAGPQLRIAIATRDGKSLNAHFGSADKFAVYDVAAEGHALVRTIEMTNVNDESGDHRPESEDKNATKIKALAGCQIVFVLAIGGPVATKVIHAGIHPIKITEAEPIDSVLSKVQGFLTSDPPPWMRKVLAAAGAPRASAAAPKRSMDFLDDDT
jgi:nitrogen fixation protein NifX